MPVIDIFKMEVHPAAAIFPMMEDAELDELAEDIKANGLVHPLVTKEGQLIDGRNRREACRRAGIEPKTIELNGQDPAAYILSANINRRHLTRSQRAMAVATLLPGKRQGKRSDLPNNLGSGFLEYVRQARTVLEWMPEVAKQVLNGPKPLNEAYEEARLAKERADALPVRLEKLAQVAPDLADLVKEEKLGINAAMAEYEERKTKERIHRQGTWDYLIELERLLPLMANDKQIQSMADVLKSHPKECPTKQPITKILDAWGIGIAKLRKAL